MKKLLQHLIMLIPIIGLIPLIQEDTPESYTFYKDLDLIDILGFYQILCYFVVTNLIGLIIYHKIF